MNRELDCIFSKSRPMRIDLDYFGSFSRKGYINYLKSLILHVLNENSIFLEFISI